MNSISLNEIQIPDGLFSDQITLVLLQLRSPFPREADIMNGVEQPIIAWPAQAHKERCQRLRTVLSGINRFDRHVDIVVLPEYSVSHAMFNIIESFSSTNRTIVIGAYYNSKERINNSFAIIPTKNKVEIYTGIKIRRSIFETDVLRELKNDERVLIRLKWIFQEKKFTILILACSDFTLWPDLPLDIKDSDILISPMCSPTIEPFQEISSHAIRWIVPEESPNRSRICVLCNSVDISGGGHRFCGNSKIIGPYRGQLPHVRAGIEAGIIASIDCSKLITIPTPISGNDRAPIEAVSLFMLDEDWKISWLKENELKLAPPEIHPHAPGRIHLNKYYLFAKIVNFWKHQHFLKRISVGCSSILGYHDIIFYSYEESLDMLALRLQTSCTAQIWNDLDYNLQDSIRVVKTIKYRGKAFVKTDPDDRGYYKANELEYLDANQIENSLSQVYLYARNGDIPKKLKNELIEKCILLSNLDISDVTETHQSIKNSEYLVLVWLSPSFESENTNRIFEEHIIQEFLFNDERVRTIEACESAVPIVSSKLQAHYILHIVGSIKDLNEILFEKIHPILGKHNITCGTRVIPVVENLARDIRESFSEIHITDRISRGYFAEIITELIRENNSFVVRKIEKSIVDDISNIWRSFKKWEETKTESSNNAQSLANIRHELARCIYSICCALNQPEDPFHEETLSHLWSDCGGYYRRLAGEIEGFLSNNFQNKRESIGEIPFDKRLEEAWRRGTKKDDRAPFPHIPTISLGSLIQAIIHWNNNQDDSIISKEINIRLRQLQGCGIADFRDCFAHTFEGAAAAMKKHLSTKNQCKRLLCSINFGLVFLNDVKYATSF